jgi:alpha/beta superfamily hydrolase
MTVEGRLLATAREETPVFFASGDETLLGIFSAPTAPARDAAVVFLPGGWKTTSTARNRILVHLSRELAALGYHTFRFDYKGIGDSTGVLERFDLDELSTEDLKSAIQWIEQQGISRFVLVGFCFGGWTALSCAPDVPGVEGLVMISVPARRSGETSVARLARKTSLWRVIRQGLRPWAIRSLLSVDRRRIYKRFLAAKFRSLMPRGPSQTSATPNERDVTVRFLGPLATLVDRHVPIMFLYGTMDEEFEGFKVSKEGPLGEILSRNDSTVEIRLAPGRLHSLDRIEYQDAIVANVGEWISTRQPRPGARE